MTFFRIGCLVTTFLAGPLRSESHCATGKVVFYGAHPGVQVLVNGGEISVGDRGKELLFCAGYDYDLEVRSRGRSRRFVINLDEGDVYRFHLGSAAPVTDYFGGEQAPVPDPVSPLLPKVVHTFPTAPEAPRPKPDAAVKTTLAGPTNSATTTATPAPARPSASAEKLQTSAEQPAATLARKAQISAESAARNAGQSSSGSNSTRSGTGNVGSTTSSGSRGWYGGRSLPEYSDWNSKAGTYEFQGKRVNPEFSRWQKDQRGTSPLEKKWKEWGNSW